jgi:hypothetical protein
MKCVICTGITGSERRECLQDLDKFPEKSSKFRILDPWLKTKELHSDISEATILSMDDEQRLSYFSDAYKDIANTLKKMRQDESDDSVAVIPMHSVFYWKQLFKDAIRGEFIEWLLPDLFITVVHNMKAVKVNLDKDEHSRFSHITFQEILQWRQREIKETKDWADTFKKQHVVIARNEPIETLNGVLFKNKKRIYFSYPMSYVSIKEMNKAKELIKELRRMGYVVFDPDSIDDAKYIGELNRLSRQGKEITTNENLLSLAMMVGNHTVDLDYRLIDQSDMVVVRYPSVKYKNYIAEQDKTIPAFYVPLSAGVICEMARGNDKGKKVFAVWLPKVEPSPFFRYQCFELFRAQEQLLDHLKRKEPA